MERVDELLLNLEERMQGAIEATENEFAKIRTGRANPALLDAIVVEYYGVETPLNQIASVTIPEGNQLYIKPFDKSVLKKVEYAIGASNIGITPQNDGAGIRLVLPTLTEERRKNLAKDVEKIAESGKVVVRNIRRDGNDELKGFKLPEDAEFGNLEEIQKLTDKYVEKMDEVAEVKIKEIMSI